MHPPIVIESRAMVAWRGVEGRAEGRSGKRVSQKGRSKVLVMMALFTVLIVVMAPQLYRYVKIHQIAHYKYINITGYQYLHKTTFKRQKMLMGKYDGARVNQD